MGVRIAAKSAKQTPRLIANTAQGLPSGAKRRWRSTKDDARAATAPILRLIIKTA